jgi:homoserine dehydrogenase
MSAVLEADHQTASHPGLRTINIGLLGLGQVGQAVARLVPEATRVKDAGYRLRVAGALVRTIGKARRCPKPARLTTNPSAFLRGNYDVVVEMLNDVEPANSIVRRLLGRGVSVVTANKALVATHGQALSDLAAQKGATFRYEAAALAGVPFLGTFAARPLVSDVRELNAIVNGTSNFILSSVQSEHASVADALAQAQARGLTEPDAARDLDGRDAADKLALLSSLFGWGALPLSRVDVQGIGEVTADDCRAAEALGGVIKPIIHGSRRGPAVSAFVGPTLIPRAHPLASLSGALSGIQLAGTFVSDLFFSGPGAGPDVTAATLLDDVVEAAARASTRARRPGNVQRLVASVTASPVTEWLIRLRFPGFVPDADTVHELATSHYLSVRQVTDSIASCRWIRTGPLTRAAVLFGLERLASTHRVQPFALRAL